MDIGSGKGYPESALSNFAPHRFVVDGVQCNSMEGFLQSLKFENPEMQKEVCLLVGIKAKRKGYHKNWRSTQILHWQGMQMPREGLEYTILLDRAYQAMYDQCEGFRKALAASGTATLTHSIGKRSESETVLTRTEFCSRLTALRAGYRIYIEEGDEER